ncbi:hypothetical protein DV738_g2256, partial [Chaetothyriales sp. CBS 135597]
MRPALLAWALAALSVVSAGPVPAAKGADAVPEIPLEAAADAQDYTVFNGIKVPPLKEIQGDEFDEAIQDGYWWVKFYSPYCGHCKAIAPLWQTLYEFYYTSDPLEGRTTADRPDLSSANSFHGFYNFHFASLNCVAFGDVCKAQGVKAWPTFLLFKDGVLVEKYSGGKKMEDFSSYVEEVLERIKPGSRPREGVRVPKPGATKGYGGPPLNSQAKDKDAVAGVAAGEKHNDKVAQEKDKAAKERDAQGDTEAAEKDTEKVTKEKDYRGGGAEAALAAAPAAAEKYADSVAKEKDYAGGEKAKDKVAQEKDYAGGAEAAAPAQAEPRKAQAVDPEAESKTTSAVLSFETARNGKPNAAKQQSTPNPQGLSVPLTAESFQKLVTNSQDSWFIKFYVPWCGHCQNLAPTWAQMAREMEGKLNIGEVNCDESPRLCKDAKVSGYPTIYFFRGGERVEYNGLRGLGDLISFADKAVDSDVKYVDADAFKEMEETEEVIFVYFFDHATTSEDFAALDRLTLSLIGHAKIVKTDSQALANRFRISTWPRLLVSRDGRPSYYNALAPKDMRDFRKVLTWMQSVWRPLVPELTASNAKDIMTGKYVVLGILSRKSPDEFIQSRRELKNAALEWMDKQTQLFQLERQELRDSKQLRIEEAEDRNDQRALRQAKSIVISITEDDFRKGVNFAWVDGVFWERWLRSTYGIDVSKGERVIINDEDNRRYWDRTDSGAFIVPSRTSILETLPRVVSHPPRLAAKSTIGTFENIIFRIRNFGTYHPYLSLGILILLVPGLFYVLRNSPTIKKSLSRSSSGYFKLDGKDGLLGVANGKAD